MTGLTTTGLTTSGLTGHPTGNDSAVPGQLCASDAVEPVPGTMSIETTAPEPASSPNSDQNADSWRVEVAARLERYRTRRKPRTPRYPSLLLPFDAPEGWSRPAPSGGSSAVATAAGRVEQDFESPVNVNNVNAEPMAAGATALTEPYPAFQPSSRPNQEQGSHPYPELSAKVIEFPRSAAIPVFRGSELADPVFDLDRPRIVEAPEILPPPPALGGMLIESLQPEPFERRADSIFAYPSASKARRALAALVDGVVLTASLAAFVTVVLRLNPSLNAVRGPLPLIAGMLGVIAVLLWAAYGFLLVVYTGSTPGLRLARLQLAGFDGSPVNRRTRRWRVLASFLSAFSAGLGYFWCVLDQDGLCWHDRITRTHIVPTVKAE